MLVFLGGVAKIYPNLSYGAKRNTNRHFRRRCHGWIPSPYLVIVLRNANSSGDGEGGNWSRWMGTPMDGVGAVDSMVVERQRKRCGGGGGGEYGGGGGVGWQGRRAIPRHPVGKARGHCACRWWRLVALHGGQALGDGRLLRVEAR
jgi:hypothetical protein